MKIFSVILVLIGAGFIAISISTSRKLYRVVRREFRRKWAVLSGLMCFFLLGYFGYIASQLMGLFFPLELLVGCVFLGGALFVYVVINLSKETVTKLSEFNQTLEKNIRERTSKLVQINKNLQEEVSEKERAKSNLTKARDQIYAEKSKIEAANRELKTLLKKTYVDFSERFKNDNLLECWNEFHCDKTTCPAYHADNLRCWQMTGTLCNSLKYQNIVEQICSCETCKVYLQATNDPISSIGEQFNNLMCILEERAKELELSQQKAEQASKAKSDFLAHISHEVRTPLNGIIGMLELSMDSTVDENQKNFLFTINSEVNALLSIINDILDFSKIEAGKLDLEEIPFDLATLLEDIAAASALNAQQKRLEFISFMQPGIPQQLIGDPGRLRQILMNLIGNALKFTQTGEIFVHAEMTEKLDNNKVKIRFQVKDTGIGIPEDKQATIFESFTQVDDSTTRRFGGTGLGTTISKQLTEMMGGEIGLESEPGKGSTFWFTTVLTKQADAPSKRSLIEEDFLGLRILLVDDNRTNLTVLETCLTSWGGKVEAVSNAKEALEKIKISSESPLPYNLILTDQHMPEMDGIEFVAAVRKKLQIATIPIILLASTGHPLDATRCREQGINGYVTKPIRKNELKNIINTVLGFIWHEESHSNLPLIAHQTIAERDDTNHPRILLVEDYPTNQQVATMHMERAGFIVELAENGKQAVSAYKSRPYDIILMDIQMPEMDGYEATRIIREFDEEKGRKTPIIAMTAYASREDREKCLAAGMNDFMTKPLRRKELLGTLEKWLETNAGTVVDTFSEKSIVRDPIAEKPAASPVDFDLALDELKCTDEFLMKVLESFAGSAKEKIDQISAAIALEEFHIIERASHGLKGSAATIFAKKFADIAEKLEIAARDEDIGKINTYFIDFQKEYDRFTAFIQERQ